MVIHHEPPSQPHTQVPKTMKCSQEAPIAVLAIQLTHLIEQHNALHQMMQVHLKAGCADTSDCKLNDRVVKLEGTAHNGRKIVWIFLTLWIGSVAAFLGQQIGG